MKVSKRGLFKGLFAATVVPTVANNLAILNMYPELYAGSMCSSPGNGGMYPPSDDLGTTYPGGLNVSPFHSFSMDCEDGYLLTDIGGAI